MSKIIVRIAREEDKKEILALFDGAFNAQQRSIASKRNEKFWAWKYENNIFDKAIVQVVEVDNQIVAAGSMWPWHFTYNGSLLKAYQLCDSAVALKFRKKGLFYRLNKKYVEVAKENGYDFIFNFPNLNSLPVHLKMGRIFIGKLPWFIKILKPLKTFKYVLDTQKSEKLKIPSEYQLRDTNKLYKIKDNIINKLEIYRVGGFYEWRYFQHSSRQYGIIEVENNDKYAFVIFTLSRVGDSVEMIIVDSGGSHTLSKVLLKKVLKSAKLLDAAFLFVVRNEMFNKRSLLLNGFIPKKNKNLVCYPLKDSVKDVILDINNWNLNAGIHDSI